MDLKRKKILHRLKRIEGQVRGLQRLIESEAPCVDILVQVSAVTSAMKKTGCAIVSANMERCLEDALKDRGHSVEDFQKALVRFIDLA